MADPNHDLNLRDAIVSARAALDELEQLDGIEIPVRGADQGSREFNAWVAATGRRLARTGALLHVAATEVDLQFWVFKGYDDPRYDEAPRH